MGLGYPGCAQAAKGWTARPLKSFYLTEDTSIVPQLRYSITFLSWSGFNIYIFNNYRIPVRIIWCIGFDPSLLLQKDWYLTG
jgi:hypothetical protein